MKVPSLLLAGLLLLGATASGAAQTVTAFKTGERTTGMTKQCYYDALGSEYTRTYASIDLCPLSIQVRSPAPTTPSRTATPPSPGTVTAFHTGERTTGMTRQCFYNALGNEYTKTLSSIALCPLSIQVRLP